ncbi:MAG TPA: hypothetical protein VJ904_02220, partial [Tichowtungia sp.]|nr:hypothetical protein [Tichowtungia sp.]
MMKFAKNSLVVTALLVCCFPDKAQAEDWGRFKLHYAEPATDWQTQALPVGNGRLMEWARPFEEPRKGHRHVSHLYAVHPGAQYTFGSAPEMMTAAR